MDPEDDDGWDYSNSHENGECEVEDRVVGYRTRLRGF